MGGEKEKKKKKTVEQSPIFHRYKDAFKMSSNKKQLIKRREYEIVKGNAHKISRDLILTSISSIHVRVNCAKKADGYL